MTSANHTARDLLPDPTSHYIEHVYQLLDPIQFQIRILILSAGAFNDPLSGRLEIANFDELPQYDALSYAWGVSTATAPLLIGLSSLFISQNLDTALRHLRHRDNEQRLWVDAICINQIDLREKADQVKNMGVIYSRAAKCIVWLGNADARFLSVHIFLRDLHEKRGFMRSVSSEARKTNSRQNQQIYMDPDFSSALRAQRRPTKVLEGLLDLLSRPYWARVWIIQEISKAAVVQARFGSFEIPLDPLLLASRNLKTLSDQSKTLFTAIVKFRAQEQGYRNELFPTKMCLIDAIITTRYSLASVSRDKIYALLGLASDGTSLVPLLSYIATEQKVFEDLTSAIIRSQQPSNVLLLIKRVPLKERLDNAIHWSIDWADIGYHLPPWLNKLPLPKLAPVSTRTDFDGQRLASKGLHVATLTQVHGEQEQNFAISSPSDRVLNFSQKILEQLHSDLLNKFNPGFGVTNSLTSTQITDALARMIRDVQKGEASADYDLRGVYDTLKNLGALTWQKNPLWEWARLYNSGRASRRLANLPRNDVESYSTPPLSDREKRLSLSRILHRKTKSSDDAKNVQPDLSVSGLLQPLEAPPPSQCLPPLAAYHFWEGILSTMETLPEYKLGFGLAYFGRGVESLVLTCNDAQIGDKIYYIEHSILPVILRDQSEYFELIGEVCLGRQITGEWCTTIDGTSAFRSNLQKRPTIYIRLGDNIRRRPPSYDSLYNS